MATIPPYAAAAYTDEANNIQNLESNMKYDILTQHNDNARTGAATHEDILSPSSIRDGRFGYLGSVRVEGKIYAQPLYVEKAAVICPESGATVKNLNIAYVATLENFVYAIDVDRRQVCWQTEQLGEPQPYDKQDGMDPGKEGGVRLGIVSTPVIDLKKSVMYVVSRALTQTPPPPAPKPVIGLTFFLNIIDTRTHAVIARVELKSEGTKTCAFHPNNHNNRPGLLLVNDKLFLAFGATRGEDTSVEYHGFVFGFDVANPEKPVLMPQVFCSTPNTHIGLGPQGVKWFKRDGGGIWMSGGGLASDGSSIYFMTGNGAYSLASGGDIKTYEIPDQPYPNDYPNSFVKLGIADLAVQASYTDTRKQSEFNAAGIPYSFGNPTHTIFWARERSDADLGSGGVLLLGDRMIGGGKDGRIDVLDTNGLVRKQSFLAFFDDDIAYFDTPDSGKINSYDHTFNFDTQYYSGPNIHGGPVAWDSSRLYGPNPNPFIYVYAWSEDDFLKRFTFNPVSGRFVGNIEATPKNPTPTPHGTVRSPYRSMPGGMLSISSNGTSNGIIWATVQEPFSTITGSDPKCLTKDSRCTGCLLSNGNFAANCDVRNGYVPGRLYAFAAEDNGAGLLPILWGDERSTHPNNVIPRYSKFTPPTIAHGTVILATANNEVLFYGIKGGLKWNR